MGAKVRRYRGRDKTPRKKRVLSAIEVARTVARNRRGKQLTPQLKETWNAKLKACGLGMDRARKIGTRSLTYGHRMEHFALMEGRVIYEPPAFERTENE
jgi:hypothetical protein